MADFIVDEEEVDEHGEPTRYIYLLLNHALMVFYEVICC